MILKLDPAGGAIQRLRQAEKVWLFLDYDGTLAKFAPTPDTVLPDPELIELLTNLTKQPRLRLTILSGRRLEHVRKLVPVPGIILAGTYGIELVNPEGAILDRLEYSSIRPALQALKPQWEALLNGRSGYYLEDKGWSLAIHALESENLPQGGEADTSQVLAEAKRLALEATGRQGVFRLIFNDRFEEVSPVSANKGETVDFLLQKFPLPGALLIYLGDDERDEEAFEAVHTHGGIAILVAAHERPTRADLRLENPAAARAWLRELF